MRGSKSEKEIYPLQEKGTHNKTKSRFFFNIVSWKKSVFFLKRRKKKPDISRITNRYLSSNWSRQAKGAWWVIICGQWQHNSACQTVVCFSFLLWTNLIHMHQFQKSTTKIVYEELRRRWRAFPYSLQKLIAAYEIKSTSITCMASQAPSCRLPLLPNPVVGPS